MRTISERQRAVLFRVSAVTCAFAILLLPVAAQSSSPEGASDTVRARTIAVPTVAPSVSRRSDFGSVRDPFVALVDDEGSKAVAPVLLAFASGARPVALVNVDGRTVALTPGASAFGATVRYVDAHTVRLSDGRTLALREAP